MNFNELFNYLRNKYPDPKIRGKNFELYAKWFLENDSVYKKIFKKVWLWDDWPDKWGPDDGIDLIAEDNEGKIWSIQSKNYAENNIIKKGIDSFIAQSSHKDIYGMYLLTTSDNISPNSLRQMHNSEKDFLIIGVSELSRIAWPKEEDLNKKISIVKATPEPHQRVAIKNVSEGFKKEDRGKLIMACGTGKTLAGLWIKEKLKSKKTIIFFPSLGLLSDTLAEYCKHGVDKFNFLCVCSDISVTEAADSYIDNPDSLSFPTTTNANKIVEFLNKEEDSIVFSTYHSSPKIEEATKKMKDFSFDLAIFDEAHRTTGMTGKAFGKGLLNENISCKKRLFMTATPKFASKVVVAKAKKFEQEIISMDDENLYGNNFYELKFSQAIKENLLSDYRIVVCGVLDSEVKMMIDQRKIAHLEDIVADSETFANYISLAKTVKKYNIKSLITYHSTINRAKDLSDNLIKIVNESNIRLENSLFTDHINGTYPANKRKVILDKLRNLKEGTSGIVSNARCLAEGIDLPSLDGIAFVDPRKSQVEVIQAVGRAIRKVRNSNENKIATIIIPIFISNEEKIDEEIDKSSYKKIWQIVNALKDHDDLLNAEIENLRFEMGKKTLSTKPGITKITYDIGVKIGSEFVNSLVAKTIEKTSQSWMEWYGLLTEYKKEFGNVDIGTRAEYRGRRLGQWCRSQRDTRTKLSDERREKLKSLGFRWETNPGDIRSWQEVFLLLKEYKEEHGNIDIVARAKYKGYGLGSWCRTQKNTRTKLSDERREKLKSLGFRWETNSGNRRSWQEVFLLLKEYKEEHGNIYPGSPQRYKGCDLGNWCQHRRGEKRKGKLSEERIKKLEEIGFDWYPLETQWEEAYSLLKEYKEEYGSTQVPKDFTYKSHNLGQWCQHHRGDKRRGKLSEERIKKLEEIGFDWDPIETQWKEAYSLLKEYKEEHGSVSIMQRTIHKDQKLGNWCHDQRKFEKRGKLSKEKIKKLEEVGFDWYPLETQWEEAYSLLKEYKDEYGSVNIMNRSIYKGKKLGYWCHDQRKNRWKLSEEKIKKLKEIGFIFDPYEARWEEAYSLLKEYKEEHGDPHPVRQSEYKGHNLGNWCSAQRRDKRKGKLSEERIKKLEEIGFLWDLLNLFETEWKTKWEEAYSLLKEYKDEYGSVNIMNRSIYKGKKLGYWCHEQRKNKSKGKLSEERIKKLEKVGFRFILR